MQGCKHLHEVVNLVSRELVGKHSIDQLNFTRHGASHVSSIAFSDIIATKRLVLRTSGACQKVS